MTEALGGDWLRKSVEFEGLTPPGAPTAVPVASQPPPQEPEGDAGALAAQLAAEQAAKEAVCKELKSYKAMYDRQRDVHNENEVKLKAQVIGAWRGCTNACTVLGPCRDP